MVYDAMDIARYVINTAIDQEKPVSNLKLQKILYYIQAAFLVETGNPCFGSRIERWRHGPVVVEVYNKFSKFIGSNIYQKQEQYTSVELDEDFNLTVTTRNYDPETIEEEDRGIINNVLSGLEDIRAWELVDKTHQEDPWLKTNPNEEMTNAMILEYFEQDKNRGRIYGEY